MTEGGARKPRVSLITRDDNEFKAWEKVENACCNDCGQNRFYCLFSGSKFELHIVKRSDGLGLPGDIELSSFIQALHEIIADLNYFPDGCPMPGDLVLIHYGGGSYSHERLRTDFDKFNDNFKEQNGGCGDLGEAVRKLSGPIHGNGEDGFILGDYSIGLRPEYEAIFNRITEDPAEFSGAEIADLVAGFFYVSIPLAMLEESAILLERFRLDNSMSDKLTDSLGKLADNPIWDSCEKQRISESQKSSPLNLEGIEKLLEDLVTKIGEEYGWILFG